MKSRPIHDRVFIRRADGDLKSNRGIIISDIAKEKSRGGEVIAVGSGTRDEGGKLKPLDLKAGDTILFGNGPARVKIDGQELIMNEADLMGIVEKTVATKKVA